jgi:hypothetical protein
MIGILSPIRQAPSELIGTAGQTPPFILMINYDLMFFENSFFMRVGMLSSLEISDRLQP